MEGDIVQIPLYRQVGQVPSHGVVHRWHKNIGVMLTRETGCNSEVRTLNRYQSR